MRPEERPKFQRYLLALEELERDIEDQGSLNEPVAQTLAEIRSLSGQPCPTEGDYRAAMLRLFVLVLQLRRALRHNGAEQLAERSFATYIQIFGRPEPSQIH